MYQSVNRKSDMDRYQVKPIRENYPGMPEVIVNGLLKHNLQYILDNLKKEGFNSEQLKKLRK